MAARFVFDSFALMALLLNEPGAARVQELLGSAAGGEHALYMTVVNLGEVLYTIETRRGVELSQEALALVDQSPINLVEIDRGLALNAARIKAAAKMGYADCFVVACAQDLGAAIVTGDPDFKQLEGQVAIDWLPGIDGD